MTGAARPTFDAAAFAASSRAHGLVVVAGAGLSMGPPSSLPGWTAINDAFLENLALRLAEHTDGSVGYDVAEFVVGRRETADVAQPDLQAQLAEESLGEQYFELFKPLDIETWNDGHAGIAALAQTGCLHAVVTTNFDRLIELALDAAGAQATVYCAGDDFERLGIEVGRRAAPEPGPITVIKVHGSVDRAETMVDTLRQRVVGRPKALEEALVRLFHAHAVLVIGFSGADLAYNPQYLGLREGAAGSPSFVVVNRAGHPPTESLTDLVDSAGARSCMVDGTLPGCVVDLAAALGHRRRLVSPKYDPEMEFPGLRQATLLSEVQQAWARRISPVRAAVVLASIAQAAGSSDAAFRLLMRTMPYHLEAGLHSDPALPTQLGLIAATLIEAGHVDAELSADTFGGGTAALQVLSVKGVQLDTESLALLALGLALCGEAVQSDAAGLQAWRESRQISKPTVRADTVCTLARTWTLTERWSPAWVEALRTTYELMVDWGDEPRRARVGAMLTRFLVEAGQLDAAAAVLIDGQRIVQRLQLGLTGNDLLAAGGRLHLAEGRHDEALRALLSACEHYEASQQNLRLAETLLPLGEAAAAAGNAPALEQSVGRFETFLPLVPGLALPQAASKVRLYCSVGAFDEARGVVADLTELGERWDGHPWIRDLASRLGQRIGAAGPE